MCISSKIVANVARRKLFSGADVPIVLNTISASFIEDLFYFVPPITPHVLPFPPRGHPSLAFVL